MKNRIFFLLMALAAIFATTLNAQQAAAPAETTKSDWTLKLGVGHDVTRLTVTPPAPCTTTCQQQAPQPAAPTAPTTAPAPTPTPTVKFFYPKNTVTMPKEDYEALQAKATAAPATPSAPPTITLTVPSNPELDAAIRGNQATLDMLKVAVDKLGNSRSSPEISVINNLLVQLVAAQTNANQLQAEANKIDKGRAGSERHQTFFMAVGDGIELVHTGLDGYRDIKGNSMQQAQSQSQVAMAAQLANHLNSMLSRAMAKRIVYGS